jgi:hypothetical protein
LYAWKLFQKENFKNAINSSQFSSYSNCFQTPLIVELAFRKALRLLFSNAPNCWVLKCWAGIRKASRLWFLTDMCKQFLLHEFGVEKNFKYRMQMLGFRINSGELFNLVIFYVRNLTAIFYIRILTVFLYRNLKYDFFCTRILTAIFYVGI